MPKLTAKRGHNPYLTFQASETDKALVRNELILKVAKGAAESLVQMVYQENRSAMVEQAIMHNYRTLRGLHRQLRDEADALEETLKIVRQRLREESSDLLEGF